MGRKRNQGKARKAAKAMAREEAEEVQHRSNNESMTSGQQQSLTSQMLQLQVCGNASPHDTTVTCRHGFDHLSEKDICFQYANAFREAYNYKNRQDCDANLSSCLIAAHKATILDKFAEVGKDSAKMEIVISYFLSNGTQYILEGNYDAARTCTIFARWFEQCTAVGLHKTQALINRVKIDDANNPSDIHTLVKFLRKRIPCKCLDRKYKEVKDTAKLGFCYNTECTIPNGQVERGKTFYCSRCRSETYCSRDCQKADWINHKQYCDTYVAEIAKFEAKKQQQQPQS